MSFWNAAYGYVEELETICIGCGAQLVVEVPRQDGHEESEEYYCPLCRSENRTRASNTPRVISATPRNKE